MFCPNCGVTVDKKLRYCKSCGVRLGADEEKEETPASMLNEILETLFWTAMVGFGILIGLVAVLIKSDLRSELVGVIAVSYLAILGLITFMLARQVPKLIDAKLKTLEPPSGNEPAQLRSPTTAQLEEFREPAMSVTDRTTKTLNKVPR